VGDLEERYNAILDAQGRRSAQLWFWQVTHHPGWKATAGTVSVPISKDGLGQIVLSPDNPGDYDITRVYDGGRENKLLRVLSAVTLMAAVIAIAVKVGHA
jgi:hypothetical protein